MQDDERAIRNLVEQWLAATKAGDLAKVLTLMDDDVLFIAPGRQPFGKEAFAAGASAMKGFKFEGTSNIQELKVLGDWAWVRNQLVVAVTPPAGTPTTRSGYTLTILRKKPNGAWVIFRDANLVS